MVEKPEDENCLVRLRFRWTNKWIFM